MNIELPDGRVIEIPDGVDIGQVQAALSAEFGAAKPDPNWRDNPPPEGYVTNPHNGQMTSRDELKNFHDDRMTRGKAARSGFAQGATFQFGDELFGRTPYARENIRAQHEVAKEKFPWTTGGAEMVGSAPAAVAGGSSALGATSLDGAIAKGSATGAAEGFAWGFGRGEGGPKERLKTGGSDAVVGGLVGAVAPAVLSAGRNIVQAASDPVAGIVSALTGKARQGRANRAISETVRRSGKSVDELTKELETAKIEGQPEFVLMDALGKPGQRRASGVARAGGDGSKEIAEFLEGRQTDQGARVGTFIDEAFGTKKSDSTALIPYDRNAANPTAPVGTAQRRKDVLTANRGVAADGQYQAAREGAGPVDVREALKVIDDYTAPLKDVDITDDSTGGALMKFRQRLAVDEKSLPDGVTSMELSDFDRITKLKADVQQARMKASGDTRRQLAKLEAALDSALESASPAYRTANDNFAEASRNIAAVDAGKAMAKSGRAADNIDAFSNMAPGEQASARVGYADDILEKMERNPAPTANKAKPLTSPKATAERNAMALDAPLLDRRLARENTMWETQNRALQGSKTADNIEDIGAARGAGSGPLGVLNSVGNMRFGDAARNAWGMVAPYATGENEATRALIARALMSRDPKSHLAPAIRQDMQGQKIQRLVEMLSRRGAITANE